MTNKVDKPKISVNILMYETAMSIWSVLKADEKDRGWTFEDYVKTLRPGLQDMVKAGMEEKKI